MLSVVAAIVVSGLLKSGDASAWHAVVAKRQSGAAALVTIEEPAKPRNPLFAELFDTLPPQTQGFDPFLAQGNGLAATVEPIPMAKEIYATLSLLLSQPYARTNEVVWPDNIDPFYWVAHLTHKNPTGFSGYAGDWWAEYYKTPKRFLDDPKLALKSALLPLIQDFRTDTTVPKRVEARRLNNGAIADLFNHGSIAKAVDQLLAAAKADETYPVPMYNVGILQASGMEATDWKNAVSYFDGYDSRRSKNERKPGSAPSSVDKQVTDWKNQIKMLQSLNASDATIFPSRVYMEDIRAAMVLVQVGQYRSAIALASEGNDLINESEKDHDATYDRPLGYLVAALVAAINGKEPLAKKLVLTAEGHAFQADQASTTALFRKVVPLPPVIRGNGGG